MLSTHIPGIAHGLEAVTGSAIIDTGLRNLEGFSACIQGTVAANEESIVSFVPIAQSAGETAKVTVYVYKGGTAHATAGDSAVNVSWIAIGS